MLKLLNKSGIPNVIDFSLTDPTYNELALLAGFDVKQRTFKSESKARRNAKANNYLAKQFNRLRKHAEKGNFEAFNKVGLNLLQNSTSYLIYSFNSVNPKWTSMDFNKVIKMLKGIRKLCKTLATDIDYKRVWIDKKPGDYARPLGVPEMIWRVYLRMVTNEGEIFAYGRDLYHPSQHGGRPGYGVMSCLKEVAETLPRYKRVYEFDLKGFFDHISHASMTTIFKGTFLEGLYSKMLVSVPKDYTLPEPKADKQVPLLYDLDDDVEFWDKFYAKYKSFIEFKRSITELSLSDIAEFNYAFGPTWSELIPGIDDLFDNGGLDYNPAIETYEEWQEKIMKMMHSTKISYANIESYSSIAKGTINRPEPIETSHYSEAERAFGRDTWKDLNLSNQGVPQGTSFGPFLSSLAVSVYYKEQALKDWIMYIDDGLIFHNTAEELAEKLVRLNKALDKMSVELAPEKSRLHTYESLIDNSIKFLGIRFKNTPGTLVHRRNFFTISSDTRSGTIKTLPPINTEQMLTILENMLQEGAITLSKYKYARWAVLQSRMRIGFEADVVTLSIKYNFFGYLLSWLYNPEMDMETTKRKINEGIRDATNEILRQRRSLGSYILRNSRWSYQDSKGMIKTTTPDLNNHSTLCVDLLLETLQNGNVSSVKRRLVSKGTSDIRSTTHLPHVAVWGPEIFNRVKSLRRKQ
jgi:hypothetical protein